MRIMTSIDWDHGKIEYDFRPNGSVVITGTYPMYGDPTPLIPGSLPAFGGLVSYDWFPQRQKDGGGATLIVKCRYTVDPERRIENAKPMSQGHEIFWPVRERLNLPQSA